MTEEKVFCRIPVKLIIKLGEQFPYDAYLKLSDSKIVKISHQNEPIKDAIMRYHQTKGVKDIYVSKDDYIKILNGFKTQFHTKLFNPETTLDEKVEIMEKSYSMVKESLSTLGISEETIEMAKKISEASIRLVKESPNLFILLKKFSEDCAEEFKKSLVIGYLCTGMIDTFDWGTQTIKEKCSLAAILCDILLSPDQIKDIQVLSQTLPLPPDVKAKIGSHPLEVVQSLNVEHWISRETLGMIEQHHEEQDGTGFPLGIIHTRISQLSAVFIVAMRFTDLVFENNFDFKEKDSMIYNLKQRYNLGVFKKSMAALAEVLNPKEIS